MYDVKTLFGPTRAALHSIAFGESRLSCVDTGMFYTNRLLHQAPFSPSTFYTKQLLIASKQLYTKHLHNYKPFTPRLLHHAEFARDTFYTRNLLITPNSFHTEQLLRQAPYLLQQTRQEYRHQEHLTLARVCLLSSLT